MEHGKRIGGHLLVIAKELCGENNGNVLYKRNRDMVLLRCVDAREAEQMLVEVHEGSFGTHANGHAMA